MEENNNSNQQSEQFGGVQPKFDPYTGKPIQQTDSVNLEKQSGQPQSSQFGGQPQMNQFGGQQQSSQFGGQQQSSQFGGQQQSSQFGGQPQMNQFSGQQQMNQFGGQPQMNNQFGAPQPPKKKSKAPLIAGLIALFVVLIGGAAFAAFKFGGFGFGKESFEEITGNREIDRGLHYVIEDAKEYNIGISEKIDFEELFETARDNTLNTSGNLNLTISGREPISGGLKFDSVIDSNNKTAMISADIKAMGTDIATATITATEDRLYVASDKLGDDVYHVDLENIVENFDASEWSSLMGVKLGDTLKSQDIEDIKGQLENQLEKQNDSEELAQIFKDTFGTLEIQYGKADNMMLDLNSNEINCKGVNMTIAKDDFNSVAQEYFKKFLESNYYQKLAKQNNMVVSSVDFEATTDVTLSVYFDKKGHIVKVMTPNPIEIKAEDSTASLKIDIDFRGKERTTDEIFGFIDIETEKAVVNMTVSRNASVTKDGFTDSFSFNAVSSSGESMWLYYDNSWSNEDNSFNISASVEENSKVLLGVKMYGDFADITKGKEFTLNLNDFSIEADDTVIASVDGSVTMSNEKKEVEIPEDSVDFLGMSQSDIYSMIMKMMY